MRADDAQRLNLHTISDAARVASQLRLGVGYEFESRPDGLPGLSAAYNLHFAGAPRTMDLGLLYRALANHQVDIVAGNSTDGPIRALGLTVLADDRHYFPPYQAVPLVREDSLARHPEIQIAMDQSRQGHRRRRANHERRRRWQTPGCNGSSPRLPREEGVVATLTADR